VAALDPKTPSLNAATMSLSFGILEELVKFRLAFVIWPRSWPTIIASAVLSTTMSMTALTVLGL
jgi:hypothetical protein